MEKLLPGEIDVSGLVPYLKECLTDEALKVFEAPRVNSTLYQSIENQSPVILPVQYLTYPVRTTQVALIVLNPGFKHDIAKMATIFNDAVGRGLVGHCVFGDKGLYGFVESEGVTANVSLMIGVVGMRLPKLDGICFAVDHYQYILGGRYFTHEGEKPNRIFWNKVTPAKPYPR